MEGVLADHGELELQLASAAYDPQRGTSNDLVQAVANAGNDGHHNYQAQFIRQGMVYHRLSTRFAPGAYPKCARSTSMRLAWSRLR